MGFPFSPQFCSCHVYAMHNILSSILYSIYYINKLFPPLESEHVWGHCCWTRQQLNKHHSLFCGVSQIEFKWNSGRWHVHLSLGISWQRNRHHHGVKKRSQAQKNELWKTLLVCRCWQGQEWNGRYRINFSMVFIHA